MATPHPNATLAHLLGPDTRLPSQSYLTRDHKTEQHPERRLAVAVLQDAVECVQSYSHARGHKKRRLYLDAKAWILSTDRTWPFSFENVCDWLQLDPEHLRWGVLQWARQDQAADGPIPEATAR